MKGLFTLITRQRNLNIACAISIHCLLNYLGLRKETFSPEKEVRFYQRRTATKRSSCTLVEPGKVIFVKTAVD